MSRLNGIRGMMLALVLGVSAPAQAVVIDFESLQQINASVNDVGTSYTEDGFTFSQVGPQQYPFAVFGTNESRFVGSTALFNNTIGGITRLTFGGNPFSISSIDLANLNVPGSVTLTFVGTKSDATTVSQTFTFNSYLVLTTFSFSSQFSDLVRLDWGQDNYPFHQFDNLVVNQTAPAVPEPTSLLLLGTGIAGLATRVRRRARH